MFQNQVKNLEENGSVILLFWILLSEVLLKKVKKEEAKEPKRKKVILILITSCYGAIIFASYQVERKLEVALRKKGDEKVMRKRLMKVKWGKECDNFFEQIILLREWWYILLSCCLLRCIVA